MTGKKKKPTCHCENINIFENYSNNSGNAASNRKNSDVVVEENDDEIPF